MAKCKRRKETWKKKKSSHTVTVVRQVPVLFLRSKNLSRQRDKGDLKRDDPLRSMSSSASAVSRFIRRADEISKHEPTTSYYCKLRAIEVAMESTPRPDDLIRKLLEQLEVRAICLFFFSFAFAWLLSLSLSLSRALLLFDDEYDDRVDDAKRPPFPRRW